MIEIKNLSHTYRNRNAAALHDVSLDIKKGEHVVIIGPSGSGKSTLLKCINRLIDPSSGRILINGQEILSAGPKEAETIRGTIGMIFQNFNLIERQTVRDNVLNGRLRFNHPARSILSLFSEDDHHIVDENVRRVGLEEYCDERVGNLSGGQKQRVAIARALSQQPDIILADEPVSNLDPKLMKEVMDLLKKICLEKDLTLVTTLHFLDFAKRYASRIVGLREGRIAFDGAPDDLTEKDIVEIYGKTKDWYLYGKTGF